MKGKRAKESPYNLTVSWKKILNPIIKTLHVFFDIKLSVGDTKI